MDAPFPMPAPAEPVFPQRDFPITDFGAKADGEFDNTNVLRETIRACHAAGGGRVVVPAGTWLTGAIFLRSRVNLQRLMVLSNFFNLAGIESQQALRWFLEMYVDAFDWVMVANVIGMALHADGGYMATKPYVSSAAYINRMSDYCAGCRFDSGRRTGDGSCPFNYLYRDFLVRHSERFDKNPRMRAVMEAWRKRPEGEKHALRNAAAEFLAKL